MTHRPAKYLLAVRGLSQRAVARSYGCGHTYLNDVLAGRRKPSGALRSHIASMLDLSESVVWPEFIDPEKEEGPATTSEASESISTEGANLDRSHALYA